MSAFFNGAMTRSLGCLRSVESSDESDRAAYIANLKRTRN